MAERKKSVTDEFDDIDVEEIPPDQDHAHLADGNVDNEVDNNVDLLKATNLSLKLELEKKDILINEKDLKADQLEITEQLHVARSLLDDFKNKGSALLVHHLLALLLVDDDTLPLIDSLANIVNNC